jgi:target of rapamycin complex subunit LST8
MPNQPTAAPAPARHDMSVILVTGSYDHEIRFWEAWSGICSRTISRSGESGVRRNLPYPTCLPCSPAPAQPQLTIILTASKSSRHLTRVCVRVYPGLNPVA